MALTVKVPRTCLFCDAPFLGRRNARYCSQSCKAKEKRQRKRVREIQGELAHVERRLALARIVHDRDSVRFLHWRAQQLRSDLILAQMGITKRGAKHLESGERIA